MKKIIIIGANHAGISAVNTMYKYNDNNFITIYEKREKISFLGCGVSSYVSGKIKNSENLFYSSISKLEKLGVNIKGLHEVMDIDFENKIIYVKNLKTDETFTDSYDKLIIASGSMPSKIIINDTYLNSYENVYDIKWFEGVKELIEKLSYKNIQNIIIIGGGYIGIELSESIKHLNKNISIVEKNENLLSSYYDIEFQLMAKKIAEENNITLYLGSNILDVKTKDNKINKIIFSGKEIDVDLVIISVGSKSNTDFIKSGIEMDLDGSIIVNDKQETSVKNVYAIGDCTSSLSLITGKKITMKSASSAIRTGAVAAMNILEKENIFFHPIEGSNSLSYFGMYFFSTGLNSNKAISQGIKINSSFYNENKVTGFQKKDENIYLKIIYREKDKVIIGAQLASKNKNVSSWIHVFTALISKKTTIWELKFMDFFINFDAPFNLINDVALKAE